MRKITADEICLDYPIVGAGHLSLKNTVLGAATGGLISVGSGVLIVNALKNISFVIEEGDRVGLIGHNGAGKSTLLKVLAGIYRPTSGALSLSGSIVSTLNLSLGMELEATGIENIMIRGLLLGMKKNEIKQKLNDIAEFTELGAYLNMPVRVYSYGMLTRLAFATVTAMNADILLMDEVINAGDASFMDKAERRLGEFMRRSEVIVLASHSEETIKKFCNKAILLEHGRLIHGGKCDEVIQLYHERLC